MRPWTEVMGRMRGAASASFNGATALRPWTDRQVGICRTSVFELQWGHGLAAVDGGCNAKKEGKPHELQWGHGLAAVDGAGDCK